jgi:hypothetical protein
MTKILALPGGAALSALGACSNSRLGECFEWRLSIAQSRMGLPYRIGRGTSAALACGLRLQGRPRGVGAVGFCRRGAPTLYLNKQRNSRRSRPLERGFFIAQSMRRVSALAQRGGCR